MKQIRDALAAALQKGGLSAETIPLEHTADFAHGDYASGVAMMYAKQAGTNPRVLAEKLVASMGTIEGVSKIEIAGPGFINFTLAQESLVKAIAFSGADERRWGSGESLKGRKIMIEYTDPNPLKEFHIGHLMSNAIGESIARLLEFAGAEVRRANYQGDVGLHVAKALWGKMQKPNFAWGQAYAFGAQNYEGNKEAIDEINKKIYVKNDEVLNEMYIDGVKSSLEHFERIYAKLGMIPRVHTGKQKYFDYYFFESTSWQLGKAIVEKNTPAVFEESDGAIVFHGEKYDPALHTRVFITSKGLPTYEAKELGLLESKINKSDWSFDESITITANEQSDYFKVVLAAAKQIPELAVAAAKTKHVTHGMMRLPSGKMSSRTGDVVTGESLLNELIEVAKDRATESRTNDKEKLAQEIAVAAIKFQILKGGTSKDIIFDRERALAIDGDSGPYLQYTNARARAIVEQAREKGYVEMIDPQEFVEQDNLIRLAYRFPEKVEYATEHLEPHLLTTYLIELAGAFNSWYARTRILDSGEHAPTRVAITDAVHRTLKNGLWLLGIPAPEKV